MAAQQDVIEADFVVIGAGSAGCAVAARLSEDPATRVVLLEAGGEDKNRWIHIPLGFGKTFADPSVNWCYETEPDPGAADRRVFWPRGKVLGGSSSINGMVYIRGQAEDFDHWRQLGNTGWSFDDVLPYFKRSEDQTRGADAFHGTGGPLCVSDVPDKHPICEAFIESATSLGFPRNDDFNGAGQDGVGYHQTTTRNGKRCSTAVGYLRPAMNRANLRVITNALTEKIVFDGRRATGVTFRQDGQIRTARAASEVILCGGAVNSPQLLMLSGIGKAEHLVATRGPGRAPFGRGRAEPAGPLFGAAQIQMRIADHGQRRDAEQPAQAQSRAAILHVQEPARWRWGPRQRRCSRAPGRSWPRPTSSAHARRSAPTGRRTGCIHGRGLRRSSISCGRKAAAGSSCEAPTQPIRRRCIRIISRPRPTSKPSSTGFKLLRRIMATPAMQRFIASEFQPGPAIETDEQLLDYARRRGGTVYHPTSTCKMGVDAMAVVDPELRVHGLVGLRVADASIMPTVVSGNTNAATIMIGEKVSDMVRQRMRLAA